MSPVMNAAAHARRTMHYAGIDTLAYPSIGRRRLRAWGEWLRAGRDDE